MSAHHEMTLEERAKLAELLGDAQPARNSLLLSFGKSVRDRREHDHTTQREDWYCLNLAAYMGERTAPVLRRLLDAESRAERYRTAWRMAYQRALGRGWAADRAGARAREGQEALQHMLFTVIASQLARKAATDEAADLRARTTELLAEHRIEVLRLVDEQFAAMKLPEHLQGTFNAGSYADAWRRCRAVVLSMIETTSTEKGTRGLHPREGESTPAVPRPGPGAPITYAGHTWPSAYEWCLWIMQHNAAPGPAQNGQRAALAAYRTEVRAEALHEATTAAESEATRLYDDQGQRAAGGARAVAELLRQMTDQAQAAPVPLVVSRYDTAIEPAPEEDPVLTVGAIAEDGRPVALLFDEETRAKVSGWLAPAELERLRRFASVTERRHDEIRDRLATVDIRDSAEAWDLGMAIIAILESPPHPDATPGFFLPGHTYRRAFHGQFVYFRVSHVGTAPDSILPTAFGWLNTERGGATWSPRDESDLHGWTDVTEDGES
ncbi:hypothetical protein PV413_03360 [Streptomyces scabiei]|uniref:hypothetical protein n=1 Tax=Streptomyces scabiei TaxID=1930 RepID=UPI000E683C67|nr:MULTISPECIES: hypothetical protein [Streptomyces]MDX2749620.1 hypothetical protein [Streptomyces scabiei]MDX3146512.1 hypothetical protein [Streptomyces scabiei]MDX3196918.1 hypothetical protein [Streptomyces scabiei]QTU45938.1 hypothetical protein F3K20_14625 [Streptomyces sp. LBUM 1482]